MIRLPGVSGSCNGDWGKEEQGWVVRKDIRKLGVHDGGKPLVAWKPWETFVNIAILHSRWYCC